MPSGDIISTRRDPIHAALAGPEKKRPDNQHMGSSMSGVAVYCRVLGLYGPQRHFPSRSPKRPDDTRSSDRHFRWADESAPRGRQYLASNRSLADRCEGMYRR